MSDVHGLLSRACRAGLAPDAARGILRAPAVGATHRNGRRPTKLVVGIIRPERLDAVQRELAAAQVFRLTVSDVLGTAVEASGARAAYGAPSSAAQAYAGASGAPNSLRKVKLEVAVNEDFVEPTVRAIARGGKTEHASGDGKVFILPLEEAIRIRTGERGPDAI